jgi:hypothetical protein
MKKAFTTLLIIINYSISIEYLPAQDIFQNPGSLEEKVISKALIRFPYVAKIYPNHSATASLTNSNSRGVRFYIGQEGSRDLIQYEKIVASIAYTQTNPRTEYIKEEKQGVYDFYIFANEVDVTIDVRPNFPLWKQSAHQLASAYNSQQTERRRLVVANNIQTTQSFQSKRSLPGQTWSNYMTNMENYLYAVSEDRNYLGATGEVLGYMNKCLTSGYPLEFYNGLVYRIFQGDVPTEIEARAKLIRGNNVVLLRINTKASRNLGLPDRILHIQQVDSLMTTLVRIVLEELGESATTDIEITSPLNRPDDDDQLIYEFNKNVIILQAVITGFNFYEAGKNGLPSRMRKYSTSFSRSEIRRIWWELNLEHAAMDVSRKILSEVILIGPDDEALQRFAIDIVIDPGLTSSQNTQWLGGEPFKWNPGKYRVELYIFGVKHVTREFLITN